MTLTIRQVPISKEGNSLAYTTGLINLPFIYIQFQNFIIKMKLCVNFRNNIQMSTANFIAVNKEATEPRIPFGEVEDITSKILRSPP